MTVENPSVFLVGVDVSISKLEIFKLLIPVNRLYLRNGLIMFSGIRMRQEGPGSEDLPR